MRNPLLAFVLALFLSWGSAARLHAQAQPVQFDHLLVRDGLSHGHVLTLLQDRQGFMWFGTADGLNRYDGYGITVYQNLPLDSTSLAGDVVYALYEDREGVLWAGTNGGLSRMDRQTGRFTHYLPDHDFPGEPWANNVGYIYEDRTGALWAGIFGGGLYRLDRASGALAHYRHDPADSTTLSFNVVEAIHEDGAGTLWVATMNGLNRFDRDTGTFTRYLYPAPVRFESSVVDFIEDAEQPGTFWLTAATGLDRFVPATGERKRILSYPPSPSTQSGPFWSMPRGIVRDPLLPHVLWVAVPRDGLYRFDTRTETIERYRHDHHVPFSLGGEPHSLYVDRTGIIWVGTDEGVSRFDPAASRFRHLDAEPGHGLPQENVTALSGSRGGAVWVGTGDCLLGAALSRIDPDADAALFWEHAPCGPPGSNNTISGNLGINALYEDRSGALWIGADAGTASDLAPLNRLDPSTRRLTRYRHDPNDPAGLGGGSVLQILEDHGGALWIGTTEGLSRLDRQTGTFTHFRDAARHPSSRAGREVRVLFEDQAGQLWVGTDAGLSRFERATGTFTRFANDPNEASSPMSSRIFALYERADEPGVLWVGMDAGLSRFDAQAGVSTPFPGKDGLPKYPVVGILEDDEGRLWMSTSGAGLLRFTPETGLWQQYDEKSGVQSRRFSPGAAYKSPRTGEMFFGGANGLNIFHPDQMRGSTVAPPVVLTDFKLFGRSVPVRKKRGPLHRPISEMREIRLTHDQNVLSFDFVALHYKNPSRNQYAYRLEGFDADWLLAGNQRTATYTNLNPGTYVFRVRAANSDGVWNKEGAAVRLVILPPWWRTVWAYLVYGLVLALGLFVYDRVQRRRLLRAEREKSRAMEDKLRAEAAEAWANYLQAENQRQTQELEQARQLQLSMLPRQVPAHPLVELAAHMKTAAEVGGDYYDFDLAEDGTLTLAIGDATGHGAQAGTMVTAAKSLFINYVDEPDVVEVLRKTTRALKRMNLPKLYMAMALGRLRGRTLELAGAGMPPALLYRAATGAVEHIPLKGMPLGSFTDFPYEKIEVELQPGDTVVLMSDGFPELFNAGGELFGYEEAASVFEAAAGRSPKEVVSHFTETAALWANGRPPNDDVTFIVMRVREEGTLEAAAAARRPLESVAPEVEPA